MSYAIGRFMIAVGLLTTGIAQSASAQSTSTETLKDMLAVQIRSQGFTCGKALDATQDMALSQPDRGVWVLKCDNASFRISRVPDMAAKIEQLP